MLNRPEVYEAAIAAGQFFLLGGIYWLFTGFDSEDHSTWRFGLGSLFWGLAIGSRTSEVLPVIFLVLAAGLRILSPQGSRLFANRRSRLLTSVLVPVTLSIVALGWYNWARFGSIVEFGYRYQLTLLQLPKHYEEIFSASYVRPNLANYGLNPFTTTSKFPFIKPQYGRTDFGVQIAFPRIYFAEALTGLVYTFPFMVLALITLGKNLPLVRVTSSSATATGARQESLEWLEWVLAGVLGLELLTLLVFFFATERYLADVVPVLTLLAMLGLWHGCRFLERWRRCRSVFSGLAVLLAALTIVTSSLLAVSSYQERILATNPALIERINSLFGR
jgi:hypothetical protein